MLQIGAPEYCIHTYIDQLTIKDAYILFNENPCRMLHHTLMEVINRKELNRRCYRDKILEIQERRSKDSKIRALVGY